MNESWTEARLGDHIGLAKGLSYKSSYFDEAGDALINLKCITTGGGFNPSGVKYYTGPHKPEHIVRPGDIVLALTDLTQHGEVMGRPAYVSLFTEREMIASLDLARVELRSDALHPRYLYYRLRGRDYLAHVTGRATGTTVRHLAPRDILEFNFHLPPRQEQEEIASLLGVLDDKIELNRRMNETLEGIIQTLFRSWFVDFDPVRAKADGRELYGLSGDLAALFPEAFVTLSEGEGRVLEVPAGWSVGQLGQVMLSPRRTIQPAAVPADTPYIGLEHMPRGSIALTDWGRAGDVGSTKLQFCQDEILFGKLRPYFHKVGIAPVDGVASSDIIVISSEPQWFGFVLGHVSSTRFVEYANQASTGTRMPRANWSHMTQYKVVLPDERLADAFQALIRPLIEHLRSNIHESRTLAAVRDTLLPKLVSGAVRVPEAEGTLAAMV